MLDAAWKSVKHQRFQDQLVAQRYLSYCGLLQFSLKSLKTKDIILSLGTQTKWMIIFLKRFYAHINLISVVSKIIRYLTVTEYECNLSYYYMFNECLVPSGYLTHLIQRTSSENIFFHAKSLAKFNSLGLMINYFSS